MFFERRPISIDTIDDVGLLAEALTQHSWTLCQAFRCGPILVINDATCADGAAEFAIVETDPDDAMRGIQIESVTFGWMEERPEEAVRILIDAIKSTIPIRTVTTAGPRALVQPVAEAHAATTDKNDDSPLTTISAKPAFGITSVFSHDTTNVLTISAMRTERKIVPINPHPRGSGSCPLCA
jgi:hypothetical protein